MTQLEFFNALHDDRSESADMLEKPSMQGVKRSVIEKYSDSAHFVYELLQNADDAKATYARFVLRPDGLVFAHNGTRRFTVSDPATEEADGKSGNLGDVNAITSIANSSKTQESVSIGKFGVGFKAVFQYTQSPRIYDPGLAFRIDRFIVPELLDGDHPERRADETLFVLPFDHGERDAGQSHFEISKKLQSLSFPTLFLESLEDITFEIEDERESGRTAGDYKKKIAESIDFGDAIGERIELRRSEGSHSVSESLWLFSRFTDTGLRCSVGFLIGDQGRIEPIAKPAFCFFPTAKETGLKFIIHAPFLLTESREGIRAGERHNEDMVDALAALAADSLVFLCDIGQRGGHRLFDDGILDIIPTHRGDFEGVADINQISFAPFYERIKKTMESETVIPTGSGYVKSENAYLAAISEIAELFSDRQLAEITGNPDARWAFPTVSRDEVNRRDKELLSYLDDVTDGQHLDMRSIIRGRDGSAGDGLFRIGMDGHFVERQETEWIHRFYRWVSESRERRSMVRKVPVFLDQDRKACRAFDDADQPVLFLPNEDFPGFQTVFPPLLDDAETRRFLEEDMGIHEPSPMDYIYNMVLPQYESGASPDADEHLRLFFRRFVQCSREEAGRFADLISDCAFLPWVDASGQQWRASAAELYFPDPELQRLLAPNGDARFIDRASCLEAIGSENAADFDDFLDRLGIMRDVRISIEELTSGEAHRISSSWEDENWYSHWEEPRIDGLAELVAYIARERDVELSAMLWRFLSRALQEDKSVFTGIYRHQKDGRYTPVEDPFPSSGHRLLTSRAWLFGSDGELHAPEELTSQTLAFDYGREAPNRELMTALGIAVVPDGADRSRLSADEQRMIRLGSLIDAANITEEELSALLRDYKASVRQDSSGESAAAIADSDETGTSGMSRVSDDGARSEEVGSANGGVSKERRIIEDIVQRAENPSRPTGVFPDVRDDEPDDADEDDYTPPIVDYVKMIERTKAKSADEVNRIVHLEDLQARARSCKRYSFGWFKALLELESLSSRETSSGSKEISISFTSVSLEEGTSRTLLLKQPNRYVPQYMEDLADIPLVLRTATSTTSVAVEVASVKSNTLRAKLKPDARIDGLDLADVLEAHIEAKNPSFLIEELRKQFEALSLKDDFDMRAHLPANIEFVFGPPGTGKTTHLADKVISPLMHGAAKSRVLVLAPTNKAADVLVERVMRDDADHERWLVRFGVTASERIESSAVFRDKTFDIRELDKSVVVTTVARFAYDYFMPIGERLYLRDLNWDYIIVDEASMVPLVNAVYLIYQKTPLKFVFAGDPFQIGPITAVDMWADESIYTLVQLDSFARPRTVPHAYDVTLLTTQYRSVPCIGDIFGELTYGGTLRHARGELDGKAIPVDGWLGLGALNIIRFPVSKYESIYRAKRLDSSPYHIYSALLTFEFVRQLSQRISRSLSGDATSAYSIGIVAPYRAQADLISKLLGSARIPQGVDVQASTIHGFQGDECDLVIAVFNPPPKITASERMFLNRQNIVNVSISRARDCLIVIMPDDDAEGIENLRLVNRIASLMCVSPECSVFDAHDVEDAMFGSRSFLEDNTFSTSHQNVNVYELPEMRYEVRSESDAIDVQLHSARTESDADARGRARARGDAEVRDREKIAIEGRVESFGGRAPSSRKEETVSAGGGMSVVAKPEPLVKLERQLEEMGWGEELAGILTAKNRDFAMRCLKFLERHSATPDADIEVLTDKDRCKEEAEHGIPVLKPTSSVGKATRDERSINGYGRYYSEVITLWGRKYIVSKEWWGLGKTQGIDNRTPFLNWVISRCE